MAVPSDDGTFYQWAIGICSTVFAMIFGGWNLHIQRRLDDLAEKMTEVAKAGDRDIWAAMDNRHQQNLAAIEGVRAEQQRSHNAIADELHRLRESIAEDRRQEISLLRQEIRNLKGAPT